MTWSPNTLSSTDPVLWGPDGTPLGTAGRLVAPHALNFASVVQNVGRVYPFRWDEALRDNPANALAMRRDAFYRRLMQERCAATVNLEWEVTVADEEDPAQAQVKEGLQQNWRDTPDKPGLVTWLLEAIWYGRSAQQWVWGEHASGQTGVTYHEPVNGDSVQFDWAGTPVVLVGYYTARRFQEEGAAAVLGPKELGRAGVALPSVVSATDRGAWGLKLDSVPVRRRFAIHKHVREAADYFEGELAGGVHGVGLRSWCYWSDWMKKECMAWMLGLMQSTGTMDLLIFNYPSGDEEGRKTAEANAKQVTGKLTLVCPRDPRGDWPAVEQVQCNDAGIAVLMTIIKDYFDVQIEHLFVGQSMSTGGRDKGSLGGTGRAEFAKETKAELQKTDALRLAETLTKDWLIPCRDFNFPGSRVPVRLEPVVEDPEAEKKVDGWLKAAAQGVTVAIHDIRKKLGIREPKPGEPTIGGVPQVPGRPGAGGPNPVLPPGKPGGGPGKPPPNPALPPGPPNPVLPAGESGRATTAAPNPVLPVGYSTEDASGHLHDDATGRFTGPGGGGGGGKGEPHQRDGPAGYGFDPAEPRDGSGKWTKGHERVIARATARVATGAALTPHQADGVTGGAVAAGVEPSAVREDGEFARAEWTHLPGSVADRIAGRLRAFADPEGHEVEVLKRSGALRDVVLRVHKKPFHERPEVTGAHDRLGLDWRPAEVLPEDSYGYAAAHAPAGGVTISGKSFTGGQFIPGDVMARATPAERAAVAGGGKEPGRATTPDAPEPAPVKARSPGGKAQRAAQGLRDHARRRRVLKAVKNEGELAGAIGGYNLPDSEPADVVHLADAAGRPVTTREGVRDALRRREIAVRVLKDKKASPDQKADADRLLGAPADFFEVKTILTSAAGKVHMSRAARARKQRWEQRYHVAFSVVILDDRRGSKSSGHRVYVAPGELSGTIDIETCVRADSLSAVLRHVRHTPGE